MEHENKCFFSISLENGITVTGNDPLQVKFFLYDMHSAFYQLGEHYKSTNLNRLSLEAFKTMNKISNAIITIDKNMYKKEIIK